jgi:hypothetical protein
MTLPIGAKPPDVAGVTRHYRKIPPEFRLQRFRKSVLQYGG